MQRCYFYSTQQFIELNRVVAEYTNLAYHSMRAIMPHFNATIKEEYDPSIDMMVARDIGKVVLNILTNSYYALEKKLSTEGSDFSPAILVRTKKQGERTEICICDNGKRIGGI